MTAPVRRLLLVGNPQGRRVTEFARAARAAGLSCRVLAHEDLIDAPERLLEIPDEPHLVRLESTGEDAALQRRLLDFGRARAERDGRCQVVGPAAAAAADLERGEVLAPRQAHYGFERYLEALGRVLEARPTWTVLTPPRVVAELFDKERTSARLQALGVPVPDRLAGLDRVQDLLHAMTAARWRSVYVKLSCGSSASCLAVLSAGPGRRPHLATTLVRLDGRWFNTRRVRRVDAPEEIAQVLEVLFAERSVVERAIPKARVQGGFADVRLVLVDGRPCAAVLRLSPHPITNLHLGGRRGDLDQFLAGAAAPDAWAHALDSGRCVARAYGAFQIGLDVLFEPGLRAHRVIEANAFGDLLPGLGLYERQAAILAGTA